MPLRVLVFYPESSPVSGQPLSLTAASSMFAIGPSLPNRNVRFDEEFLRESGLVLFTVSFVDLTHSCHLKASRLQFFQSGKSNR